MSLDDLWARISAFLEPHELVFPTTPDSGGDCPTAVWPHDDPTDFFEFASKAAPQAFYARQIVLDEEVEERLLDDLTEDEIRRTGDAAGDLSPLHTAVAARRNESISVELGFFLGSVYHVYSQTADWIANLSVLRAERAEGEEDRAGPREDWRTQQREYEAARDDAAPRQQEWIELLCRDDGFIAAENPTGRRLAATEAIPEMAQHLNSSGRIDEDARSHALRLAAGSAIREAGDAVRSKVRPAREAEVISELDTIGAALIDVPAWDSATTKTQQRGIARDFLKARLGFTTTA